MNRGVRDRGGREERRPRCGGQQRAGDGDERRGATGHADKVLWPGGPEPASAGFGCVGAGITVSALNPRMSRLLVAATLRWSGSSHHSSRTVETACPISVRPSGRGSDSSSRMRTRGQQVAGDLQCGHGLFSGYGRKVVQKALERVTGREVIHQVLDWYARARKDGGAAQYLGVATDYGFQGGCGHSAPSGPCYLRSSYGA